MLGPTWNSGKPRIMENFGFCKHELLAGTIMPMVGSSWGILRRATNTLFLRSWTWEDFDGNEDFIKKTNSFYDDQLKHAKILEVWSKRQRLDKFFKNSANSKIISSLHKNKFMQRIVWRSWSTQYGHHARWDVKKCNSLQARLQAL